jgi:hypothetical protein
MHRMPQRTHRAGEMDLVMILMAAVVALALGAIAWSPKTFTHPNTAQVVEVGKAMEMIQ